MGISTVQDVTGIYKVTLASGEIMWVPADTENSDYVRVQAWVAAGGVIS